MQAVGLIVGPLVGLVLLKSGLSSSLTWRIMLGLGAVPAATVIYFRSKMPESPRFQSRVKGKSDRAAAELQQFAGGVIDTSSSASVDARLMGLREFLSNPRMILLMLGTAGSWFLFDYAYYGNTLSLPSILSEVSPNATLVTKLVLTLALFVIFAVPGYLLAVWKMDKIGHRRLQFIGFAIMAVSFLTLAAFPALTVNVAPFIAIFGVSYFFHRVLVRIRRRSCCRQKCSRSTCERRATDLPPASESSVPSLASPSPGTRDSYWTTRTPPRVGSRRHPRFRVDQCAP
jgi:PHS family inorganic phosphate transporter-like MFS transporter